MSSDPCRRVMPARSRLTLSLLAALGVATPALAEVTVDGRIDAREYAGAEHVTDFKLVEPLSGIL